MEASRFVTIRRVVSWIATPGTVPYTSLIKCSLAVWPTLDFLLPTLIVVGVGSGSLVGPAGGYVYTRGQFGGLRSGWGQGWVGSGYMCVF